MQISQLGPDERNVLMREWETTIHYWAMDNSILWTRCTVFILVNSIFFAPLALASSETLLPTCVLKYGIPIVALLTNILWLLITYRSVAVIRHFEQRTKQIRDQIPLLRFYSDDRKSQFHHW